MSIKIGSAVRIKATGQDGRVISLGESEAAVRLSLDKNSPSADWLSVALTAIEDIEAPASQEETS